MSEPQSDALVFFGATGDLAYKKIFPSLQAMVRRGHLKVPVIGVARAGWTLDQLKARARDSAEKHGGLDPEAFARLSSTPLANSTGVVSAFASATECWFSSKKTTSVNVPPMSTPTRKIASLIVQG